MAKTRPGSSKKGRSKHDRHQRHRSAATTTTTTTTPTITKQPRALMDDATAAMTQGDLQQALNAAREAVAAFGDAGPPSLNKVLGGVGLAAACTLLGEIYLEAGDIAEAQTVLTRAARLDPEGALTDVEGGGVDKFLYLAQLSEDGGRDSVAWFERGAAALRRRIGEEETKGGRAGRKKEEKEGDDDEDKDKDEDEVNDNKQKLAQILCAVAEVWMTDLSFEADCEAQCEALVTEATLVDPASPDVWQTLASVRISQSRDADARAALARSLALWEDLPPEHPAVPAFPVRVALVRLLLTVGWLDKAVDMAARLLRDDDEAVEVWYLAGYAQYLQGQAEEGKESKETKETKETSWREARRCLARCLRAFRLQDYEDERLGQHAHELLDEVVAVVGPVTEQEAEGEDGDDEEWEDEDEDDDEDEDEEMT